MMPDDALPPDSLVGRMLNPEPEFTAEEVEMIAAPWSCLEPLPLWRVMQDAYYSVKQHPDVLSEECERLTIAAEIDALRDWLVPEETHWRSEHRGDEWTRWKERQRLRALLTEQARIARDAEP